MKAHRAPLLIVNLHGVLGQHEQQRIVIHHNHHYQSLIRWAGSFQRRLVSNMSISAPRPWGGLFRFAWHPPCSLDAATLVLDFWETLLLVSARLQTGVL